MSQSSGLSSPPGSEPVPDGGPPPPAIIVEDLDNLERRRHDGERLPGTEHRKLLRFAAPWKWHLVGAGVLASFSAVSAAASLFILEKMLAPIVQGQASGLPATRMLAAALARAPELLGAVDAWSWPLWIVFVALGSAWASLAATAQLGLACGAFVTLSLLDSGTKYGQRLAMRSVSLHIVADIRTALFARLMGLSMRFYHANHSSKLLSRLTHDLARLGGLLVDVMVTVLTDVFTLIGMMAYLWIQAGSYVVLGVGVALLCFYPAASVARKVRKREHKNREKMGSMFQVLTESLSAQKIVKVFGAEEYERRRFAAINETYTAGRMRAAELKARTGPMVDAIGGLSIAALMWAGGMRALDGYWGPETFMAVIIGLGKVIGSIRRLADTNNKLQQGMASADRVSTVLFSEAEIRDEPDAIAVPPVSEGITFEHVTYAHEPGQPVLRDISFALGKGQTLALVGPTGAGKSTIGDLLVRLYDVDTGAVKIDGVDLRRATLKSLRGQIAMVTQDTVLFHDSVAGNIAYGAEGTPREAIEAAARAAHAHEFITEMPDGYDTLVGERGARLSGGERQRIAIARALLKDAPILILDEATSALDSRSESLVQEAIERLKHGRTTIVIAHRLATIRNADQIIVLEQGEIVERGRHAELLAEDGLYARLHGMQSGV